MSQFAYVLVLVYVLAFVMGAVGGWVVREWFHYRPVKEQIRRAEHRVAKNAHLYWMRHIARLLRARADDKTKLAAYEAGKPL